MNDPIVEEVRKFRDDHARKFNYDLDAICADLRQRQQRSGHPLVSLKRNRPANKPLAPDLANSAP
jgi:hypothetical protein